MNARPPDSADRRAPDTASPTAEGTAPADRAGASTAGGPPGGDGPSGATRSARGWHLGRGPVRLLAYLVAIGCLLTLAVAETTRGTVLDRGYYQGVLEEEGAYERLYDEVLVDPRARPVTTSLLARLPMEGAVVTANLKTVLPSTTVRKLTDEQIAGVVDYLRGDEEVLSVSVDLQPVLENLDRLLRTYLGDLVAGPEEGGGADLETTVEQIDTVLRQVSAGQRPTTVPRVRLNARGVEQASDVLLSEVPDAERAGLRPRVEQALGVGDAATALALVGPHLTDGRFQEGREKGKQELLRIARGGQWDVVEDLRGAGVDIGLLESARQATRYADGPAQVAAVVLGGLAVVFLWLTGPPGRKRRLRTVGWLLTVGGALVAALFAVVRWWAADLLWEAPASWPTSLGALVAELESTALSTLTRSGLLTAVAPLVVGVVLVAGCTLWLRRENQRPLSRRSRTGLLGGGAVLTAAAVVFGMALAPAVARHPGRPHCNGSAALCDLRYDQAAYLATHNAMSTTDDGFLSPLQDGDLTSQLDDGARALLLDTHTWERPDEITERLRVSDFAPRMRDRITEVVDQSGPTRPGLWLCHAVCRGGASPLVEKLEEIGSWMREHPREVVTLIVQDGISGEQTASAFRQAGLEDLLHTPDGAPQAAWPTLQQMIDEGERLVVFAEQADGPAAWYRNFYRYGMETPYAFSSPQEMSCRPNRGGTDKSLFLLNHFVTRGGGSRLDASEVNAEDFVLQRAHRCAAERGRQVNFVAVDFMNLGDAKAAVDALNAERATR